MISSTFLFCFLFLLVIPFSLKDYICQKLLCLLILYFCTICCLLTSCFLISDPKKALHKAGNSTHTFMISSTSLFLFSFSLCFSFLTGKLCLSKVAMIAYHLFLHHLLLAYWLLFDFWSEKKLSTKQVLAPTRDCASVNWVAICHIKIMFSNLFDIGCYSHTNDIAGNKFELPTVEDIIKPWISLFFCSPKAMFEWKSTTGGTMASYSETRWRSRWEVSTNPCSSLEMCIHFLNSRHSFLQWQGRSCFKSWQTPQKMHASRPRDRTCSNDWCRKAFYWGNLWSWGRWPFGTQLLWSSEYIVCWNPCTALSHSLGSIPEDIMWQSCPQTTVGRLWEGMCCTWPTLLSWQVLRRI